MMGWLAHPQGMGQPISEVENLTVSQMNWWVNRWQQINKAINKDSK
jgi:hypothetical protein